MLSTSGFVSAAGNYHKNKKKVRNLGQLRDKWAPGGKLRIWTTVSPDLGVVWLEQKLAMHNLVMPWYIYSLE